MHEDEYKVYMRREPDRPKLSAVRACHGRRTRHARTPLVFSDPDTQHRRFIRGLSCMPVPGKCKTPIGRTVSFGFRPFLCARRFVLAAPSFPPNSAKVLRVSPKKGRQRRNRRSLEENLVAVSCLTRGVQETVSLSPKLRLGCRQAGSNAARGGNSADRKPGGKP
jgi:hypothetical protein